MKSTEEGYIELLQKDKDLYGQSVELMHEDGTRERLDPTKIKYTLVRNFNYQESLKKAMEIRGEQANSFVQE